MKKTKISMPDMEGDVNPSHFQNNNTVETHNNPAYIPELTETGSNTTKSAIIQPSTGSVTGQEIDSNTNHDHSPNSSLSLQADTIDGTIVKPGPSETSVLPPKVGMEYGAVRLLPASQSADGTPVHEYDAITQLPKVYKRRWIMLTLFCAYSLSNAYQWIHLNIITNVMLEYYNQSLPGDTYQQAVAVDWLSMVYMLAYIPLIFPASWLLDKKGLRVVCVIGSLLNALGAWLKCASVSPDRFALLMVAQTVCAVAQIWVLSIPARLAAVWFGPNEVSTATSLGVFGNQVGVAIGFLIPPVIVPSVDDLDQIGHGLSIMFYTTAGVTTVLFIIILIFFQGAPPRPPSKAQQLAVQVAENTYYLASLKKLFKNRGFSILTLTYGINTGSYYAISTLLNPIVLSYFLGEELNAGRIGLTMVLAGVLGAILGGIWLDKTRTFKATTIFFYFFSMGGMVAFTFTLGLEKIWIVFLTSGWLGFFMTGYLPVGFEFAAEITFPEPEGTSTGLLNASAQIFGVIMTLGVRALMVRESTFAGTITLSAGLLLGMFITAFIKPDYRRQKAGSNFGKVDIVISSAE